MRLAGRRLQARQILIIALLLIGLLLFLCRFQVIGGAFLMLLGSFICFGLAFFTLLYYPWVNRRLRRFCRVLRVISFIFLFLLVVSFIFVEIKIFQVAANEPEPRGEVLLVLGAGLYGETPSAILAARLDAAYAYLTAHPEAVAVLAGGQGPGEDIPEALAMQRDLLQRGIAAERLYLEDQSNTTERNVAYSLPLLRQLGGSRNPQVVLVTSDFHLYRAKMIGERAGLRVEALGAPTPQIDLVPLNSYLREYFAVVKYFLLDLFY